METLHRMIDQETAETRKFDISPLDGADYQMSQDSLYSPLAVGMVVFISSYLFHLFLDPRNRHKMRLFWENSIFVAF